MTSIKFYHGKSVPLEMHKARIVQKITLLPLEYRIIKNKEAGNNAHLLRSEDVFLDMLTDSGVNAMSEHQQAAMLEADDAYAGSASFYRLEKKIKEILGFDHFLPAHQGRACEHMLVRVLIEKDSLVPMNHHFTTTKALIEKAGGSVIELLKEEGFQADSNCPFKGDLDTGKLEDLVKEKGAKCISFVRIESGTNLIGGQPVSLKNMQEVSRICKKHKIPLVLDASLLADNLYFIKTREPACKNRSIQQIMTEVSKCFDIIYFSARKLTCARGGGMCFRDQEQYLKVRDIIPMYEGFSTYGGISVRELEAMTVGLEETLDFDIISQGPIFIEEMTKQLLANHVPVVTPAGGLGVHLDCKRFLPQIEPSQYPAAALHAALYLVSGIRGTERGTLSEERDKNGEEVFAKMELLRLALPRRVFSLSHICYAVDRISWLHEHRDLVGGLKFVDEPKVLRFFFGRLEPIGDWQEQLIKQFKKDFGDSL